MPNPNSYTVVLAPPDYPKGCFPARCGHPPQFAMHAHLQIAKTKRSGDRIEIDHNVCLACGSSLPSTHGGNILVDLQMLWADKGWHAKIGARIIALRDKWARIATYLFDENGWNGRHEKIARLIDPNLTMKLKIVETGHVTRFGTFSFDASYLRQEAA